MKQLETIKTENEHLKNALLEKIEHFLTKKATTELIERCCIFCRIEYEIVFILNSFGLKIKINYKEYEQDNISRLNIYFDGDLYFELDKKNKHFRKIAEQVKIFCYAYKNDDFSKKINLLDKYNQAA